MEIQNLNDPGRIARSLLRESALGFATRLSGRGRERMLYPAQQGFTEAALGQLTPLVVVRSYSFWRCDV